MGFLFLINYRLWYNKTLINSGFILLIIFKSQNNSRSVLLTKLFWGVTNMEFLLTNEDDLMSNMYTPLNVVFVLVCSNNGYMLVQNKESNFWELPAGKIINGETMRECAIRRCRETSGQNAINLQFIGICKIIFENRAKYEYFAIYTAQLNEEIPYYQTNETKDMRWYKPGQNINQLCSTCSNIIKYYESTGIS